MDCQNFLLNVTDQIKEAQMKLGYEEETVRLYYPLSSLCAILKIPPMPGEQLLGRLREAFSPKGTEDRERERKSPEEPKTRLPEPEKLGQLIFTLYRERVEVSIPPKGVAYVHEQIPEPAFLRALLTLLQERPHCGIQELQALFGRFDGAYVCRSLTGQQAQDLGFDYALYFEDEAIDAYVYCVREEMGHMVYHRFAREDYKRMMS